MSISNNLSSIEQKINQACKDFARARNDVKLIAVSKTKPSSLIKQAYDCGQKSFGENYLQEALNKIDQLQGLAIEWHFIGSIQSNKAKIIAGNFSWVHSVASLKVAKLLSKHSKHTLNICLQVNLEDEVSKSGLNANETLQLALNIKDLDNIRLRGLMAIPKPTKDFQQQIKQFTKVKTLFEQLKLNGFSLDTMSMGMSSDFVAAIASGSTMLRIGSDIFGKRQ